MLTKSFPKMRRLLGTALLATGLTATGAAAGDLYGFVSMGLNAAHQQFESRAVGAGPGGARTRDLFSGMGSSLGIGIGRADAFTLPGGTPVDVELEIRASRVESFSNGTRSYTQSRQQIGVAAYATVYERPGFRGQIGAGIGARRIDVTMTEGGVTRQDHDRAPYSMVALRGVWKQTENVRSFAELRYSMHPTPRGAGQTASIEQEMNSLAVHFGVQVDLE